MEWHSGSTLSQTVYTLLYVHHLSNIDPDFLLQVSMNEDPHRPLGLLTIVLRAAVMGMLKCCDLAWREMSQNNVQDVLCLLLFRCWCARWWVRFSDRGLAKWEVWSLTIGRRTSGIRGPKIRGCMFVAAIFVHSNTPAWRLDRQTAATKGLSFVLVLGPCFNRFLGSSGTIQIRPLTAPRQTSTIPGHRTKWIT